MVTMEQSPGVVRELLVVDDEPKLCAALRQFFSERGLQVTTAAGTAREALEQLEQIHADAVLLDLRLPDSSGLEVLSLLNTRYPALRVIVISALTDYETIREAFQRGASDYLAKPLDFNRCFYAAMGLATVDLTVADAEAEALARLPAEVAWRERVLPIRWDGTSLHVAIPDPLDPERQHRLKAQVRCPVIPLGVVAGELDEAIRRHYGPLEETGTRGGSVPSGDVPPPAGATATPPAGGLLPIAPSASEEELWRALLEQAQAHRATALHLGMGSHGPWVRERVDGVLHDVPAPAPLARSYYRVVSHLKRLARLDQAARAAPQYGRSVLSQDRAPVELELSILPTPHGDSVVARLQEPSRLLPLDTLGLHPEQQRLIRSVLARSNGLVLVTGPPGSGKTTTLYAALATFNSHDTHIVTLEEAVGRKLEGATQVALHPDAGFTGVEGLRAALRHDPDLIMLGELADQVTARAAVRAAAGRLVLSTVPTADAAGAVTRLLDFGIEPFFLCAALSAVISQRLIRTLCPSCRQPVRMELASLSAMGLPVPRSTGTVELWRAAGCSTCAHTGYRGRTGAFEVLIMDPHTRLLLVKRSHSAQIRQSAVARGMQSLIHALWQKVEAGQTSLEEFARHCAP
jgi:type II secretory ATPase GspE/PulE/Tfp pilus assembly ATPase PilB-like protein